MLEDTTVSELNYKTLDRRGICPNPDAIGSKFTHSGHNETYTIRGFCWNGDTDEWHVLYASTDSLTQFSRSLTNFMGERQGKPRFVQVVPGLLNGKYTHIQAKPEREHSYTL